MFSFGKSLSAELGSSAESTERRGKPRLWATCRVIGVQADEQQDRFELRNISVSGASGTSDKPLLQGQVVRLTFEGQRQVEGSVRWTKGLLAGIQFNIPLPLDLLQGRVSAGHPAREKRYTVARLARVGPAGHERQALIRNISSKGMQIETAFALLPGQLIEVRCGKMGPLTGLVRWSHNGRAGIALQEAISLAEFEDATADANR